MCILDKEIVVKFDTSTPQGPRFHCDLKLNVTLPAAPQSMIAHVRITEKYEHEYDVRLHCDRYGN